MLKQLMCVCVISFLFFTIGCDSNVVSERDALHNGISIGIGNFSLEILNRIAGVAKTNLIISPITIWATLAVVAQGAIGETYKQIKRTIRLPRKEVLLDEYSRIAKYLVDNTTTVQLDFVNSLFVDTNFPINPLYKSIIEKNYRVRVVNDLKFADSQVSANVINNYVNTSTHGKIPQLVSPGDLNGAEMILTSAVYFKGSWTFPFLKNETKLAPFYDSKNNKIGEVNMMYQRATFPYSNLNELQARVIEIPYGKENRLSMLVMLPHNGVSLDQMFVNTQRVPLDVVFEKLRNDTEEFSDEEVDLFLPRFKISTDLLLEPALQKMGIYNVFSDYLSELPHISKNKVYLSKVIHKAQIEVNEEGTEATAITAAEFANRNSVPKLIANKPFAYMIIEKTTNVIVFGGIYCQPELY